MKLISLAFALFLSFSQLSQAADNSSRTFYLLSDTAVSHLEFGLYKLDLELDSSFRLDLARFLNMRADAIGLRTYISAGRDTGMELIFEATAKAAADRERSRLQAENICELVLGAQVRFMRTNRLINFFKTKDPFLDPFPADLAEDLDKALILKAKVPSGGVLPTTECSQPLIARDS